jgi:hypothetical protein
MCSRANKSRKLAELIKDYRTATEQYSVIVGYLKVAMEVLTEAECQLLLEFAEIEKNRCERLHREFRIVLRRIAWAREAVESRG